VSKAMGVITKSNPVESCRVQFDSLRSWKAEPYISRRNRIPVTFRQLSRVHWIWVKLLAWLCSVLIRLESVRTAACLCHLKMPDTPRANEECHVIVFSLSTRRDRVFRRLENDVCIVRCGDENVWEVLKSGGAGKGWKESDGPIVWEM